jgi:hypothetical protein
MEMRSASIFVTIVTKGPFDFVLNKHTSWFYTFRNLLAGGD